jgi:hypothetical protein
MSLEPKESLIQSEGVQSVEELIKLLQEFKTTGTNFMDVKVMSDGNVISLSDAIVSIELLERTLSDGSKAHDILFKFEEQ